METLLIIAAAMVGGYALYVYLQPVPIKPSQTLFNNNIDSPTSRMILNPNIGPITGGVANANISHAASTDISANHDVILNSMFHPEVQAP